MTGAGELWAVWAVVGDAVGCACLCGAVLGGLGIWLSAGRMAFLGASLTQVAGLGVALPLWVRPRGRWAPSPTVAAAALVFAAGALVLRHGEARGRLTREALLAVIYLGATSATLLVASQLGDGAHHLQVILFGSAVAVVPGQLAETVWLASLALGLQCIMWRGFSAALLDPEAAQVRGLPVAALQITLAVLLAWALATGTRILGALPALAMSVLPAQAALTRASTLAGALVCATIAGAAVGAVGYLAAYLGHLPVGASQAFAAWCLWGLAALAPRRS